MSSTRKASTSCFFCEKIPKTIFKCFNCDLSMCRECKTTIHVKIRGSEIHTIRKTKEFMSEKKCEDTERSQSGIVWLLQLLCCRQDLVRNAHFSAELLFEFNNVEKVSRLEEDQRGVYSSQHKSKQSDSMLYNTNCQIKETETVEFQFDSLKRYTTDLPVINRLISSSDNTLWITRATLNILQKIKIEGDYLNIISTFNIKAFDIASAPNGDLLIASDKSYIKLIQSNQHNIEVSRYDISPFLPTAIHVSRHEKIMIGAMSTGPAFPSTGERKLIVMDINGVHEYTVQHDELNTILFTYPISITSNDIGDAFVLNRLNADCEGRVVILDKLGTVKNIYSGHPIFNIDQKFKPKEIAATNDTLIICEAHNHRLHVINSSGNLIQYVNTKDILGISFPQSLYSTKDQLLIGTSRKKGSTDKSKLYIMKCNQMVQKFTH
ncbi:unnamed protein product [Mytilus coruscus]|uniref:B box-type domain-containing protein n=1 Tax=Mytilus coruscus TaxID=42192 RepID=A0A6J8D2E4_MYTCO|nr:unnamed protein product [Mytilus coruscus]